MKTPYPNTVFPLTNYKNLCFPKSYINNPNIALGDYTYTDDFEDVSNFGKP